MNWKNFALRFVGLIILALAAGPLFALTFHMLVLFKLIPLEEMETAYGNVLTMKSAYVWLACLPIAFASLFFKDSWRYALYFSPLYGPAVFAVIYTLLQ